MTEMTEQRDLCLEVGTTDDGERCGYLNVECRACGITTGYPVPTVEELQWN